ncbi:unnamed protein product [Acanthoscelides obtectus]|uniref:Uncharacterized protein n=1 Tax=Acanthoscelides obtectus TaxID=200917 RepID=A0A9P0KVY9_ACAOB|nr:unnamed protein product [Acanthoscelides obtectus]CAK1655923.1 hypothetical protein AOBTE_LOCUS19442 [Acanthoscelides obtectus]
MADQHDTVDDGQLLKILIKKRGSVKFRLTHLVKQLDAVEKDISSIEELQFVEWKQKADRMPLLWDEFAGIQCQIESLSDEPDQFQERVDFENKYEVFGQVETVVEKIVRSREHKKRQILRFESNQCQR